MRPISRIYVVEGGEDRCWILDAAGEIGQGEFFFCSAMDSIVAILISTIVV